MVMVRPSLLKLAIKGKVPLTAISAAPLLSENTADGMAASSKVNVGVPGATTGSRLNDIRSRPGSVAIVGLTGEEKFITRRGGVVRLSWAVKCVATLPTNRRRAAGLKVMGVPTRRGRSVPSEVRGTSPRPLSRRKFPGRSRSRPRTLARLFPAVNSASTSLK